MSFPSCSVKKRAKKPGTWSRKKFFLAKTGGKNPARKKTGFEHHIQWTRSRTMSSRKRRRGSDGRAIVVQQRQIRPIDKKIVSVSFANVATSTQQGTTLLQATFPCTVAGLRWDVNLVNNSANETVIDWAIVLDKEGLTTGTLTLSNGGDVYVPEQNVLAWGRECLEATSSPCGEPTRKSIGVTKTMRKLQVGDIIAFIVKHQIGATIDYDVRAAVQFFCKS